MVKPVVLLMVSALTLAGARPPAELLRKQPSPVLSLELALPDSPDAAAMKRAYLAAFREAFAHGLASETVPAEPERIQFIVVVGQRTVRTATEANVNTGVDQASSVATRSPFGLLRSAFGPKSAYESQVERLGYRPCVITGQIVLLKPGKDGFQETLRLEPMSILKHMSPLGENDRTTEGLLAEEGRAVALETLALLKKTFGWTPPSV
jgi:hypothetical protein